MSGVRQQGRDAFARQAWGDAYAHLADAATSRVDDPADLERLAVAAHLTGRDEASEQAWERAHAACVAAGDPDRGARCAFWLAMALSSRGEHARAGGWIARAERLVEEIGRPCVAGGYLQVPRLLGGLEGGDPAGAREAAREMIAVAGRFADPDLLALGVLGAGQASLMLGEISQGMRSLDEAMVAVTRGEVSPIPAGIVYCAVIEACMDVMDLRRAAEWTEALHRWCDAQPDLVAFRGQCLVHRSQVLLAHGEWDAAAAEAERACRRLADPAHAALGAALYQQGEVHRLRGELAAAERAYRAATRCGHAAGPGFALLRLTEGNIAAARSAIDRMLAEGAAEPGGAEPLAGAAPMRPAGRAATLAAAVEVRLAAAETESAAAAADELGRIAAATATPLMDATAAYAAGRVRLAQGDPAGAVGVLRRAYERWRSLEMPYEAARAGVQLAAACRALGDHDAADLELDAAHAAFERLGAHPDLDRVAAMRGPRPAGAKPALTGREREVLALVAAGRTNREIAGELIISEHTVARHLQNIFSKLGVSSRAAATARAYEHGLV